MRSARKTRLVEVAVSAHCLAKSEATPTRRRFRDAMIDYRLGGAKPPSSAPEQAKALLGAALTAARAANVPWTEVVASVNAHRGQDSDTLCALNQASAMADVLSRHFEERTAP